MERDMEAINRKEDSKLQKRHNDRKAKEMEAKIFQDRQVQEKQELKRLEQLQRKQEQERILKEVEQHNLTEAQKKDQRKQKLRMHQEEVMQQKSIEPKMFAKTGVAIVKSPAKVQ